MKRATHTVGNTVVVSILLFSTMAVAQQEWDVDRYLQLVEESDQLFIQADTMSPDDSGRRQLLMDSVSAKQDAADILTAGLLSGELDALWEDAVGDLLLLNENVIVILAELDQCIAAEMHLNESLSDHILLTDEGAAHLESLRSEIDDCDARALAVQTPDPTPEPVAPPPSSSNVVPWVLIGSGAALGLVAIVWNLAGDNLGDLETELEEFLYMCGNDPHGPPNCAMEPPALDFQEQIDSVESDHTVQIVLGAIGGVAVITGVVLLLTGSSDEPEEETAWRILPSFGQDSVGSVFQLSF